MTRTLTVSDEVRALAPGFTHVAIEATGLVNGPSTDASSALLNDAARRLAVRLDGRAPHEDPHMVAWRDAYRAFGASPRGPATPPRRWPSGRSPTAGCPGSTSWSTSTTRSAWPT